MQGNLSNSLYISYLVQKLVLLWTASKWYLTERLGALYQTVWYPAQPLTTGLKTLPLLFSTVIRSSRIRFSLEPVEQGECSSSLSQHWVGKTLSLHCFGGVWLSAALCPPCSQLLDYSANKIGSGYCVDFGVSQPCLGVARCCRVKVWLLRQTPVCSWDFMRLLCGSRTWLPPKDMVFLPSWIYASAASFAPALIWALHEAVCLAKSTGKYSLIQFFK